MEPERVDRPTGKAKPSTAISETKDHFEKRHMPERASQTTKTNDNPALNRVCFTQHNKRSQNETQLETVLTSKTRVQTMSEMRNGVPIAALGDKNYRAVEYESGFFQAGGLIAGSTNRT